MSVVQCKILAIGDSLTEGYINGGRSFHPYTDRLRELLGTQYKIVNRGVSGENTAEIKTRLTRTDLSKTIRFYRMVCILGGTNDLGDESAQHISDNLIQMHEYVLKQRTDSISCVAIGIPEMAAEEQYPEIRIKREQINERLKQWCRINTRVHYFDLPALIPMQTATKEQRALDWDDDLHFSAAGYDKMAEALAPFLMNIVNK